MTLFDNVMWMCWTLSMELNQSPMVSERQQRRNLSYQSVVGLDPWGSPRLICNYLHLFPCISIVPSRSCIRNLIQFTEEIDILIRCSLLLPPSNQIWSQAFLKSANTLVNTLLSVPHFHIYDYSVEIGKVMIIHSFQLLLVTLAYCHFFRCTYIAHRYYIHEDYDRIWEDFFFQCKSHWQEHTRQQSSSPLYQLLPVYPSCLLFYLPFTRL